MKVFILLVISFTLRFVAFGQGETFNYGDTVILRGKVLQVVYEIPTGDKFTTYILQLNNPVNIKTNDEWEGLANVNQIHLNIMNPKVERYHNEIITVRGYLFHGLTIHHIRDLCIKVDRIEN